jgi:hypothetical protein
MSRRAVPLLFLLALAAAPAGAGTLASGLVNAQGGVSSAVRVRCFLTNVGSKPVTVTEVGIVDLTGTTLVLGGEGCTAAPLAPQNTCPFFTEEGAYAGYGSASVKGGVKNLRGRCQVVIGADVFSESEMR